MSDQDETDGAGDETEFVTIAEAARRLGVPETTLRRALRTLPEYAARTRSQRHQTATGERAATVLPPDLIADLAAYFARLDQRRASALPQATASEAVRKPAENSTGNAATTLPQEHQNAARNGTTTRPEGNRTSTVAAFAPMGDGELPAQAYREIIARLERENSRLWEALRQQQEATQLAQHNLAREQALRSLPAPQTPEAPQEARLEPETGPADDARNGSETAQTGTQEAKPRLSWLARIFGTGKDPT